MPRRKKLCLACKRKLTDKESVRRMYGPVCWGKRPALQMLELETQGQLRLFND